VCSGAWPGEPLAVTITMAAAKMPS